jgi:hypothetical protein
MIPSETRWKTPNACEELHPPTPRGQLESDLPAAESLVRIHLFNDLIAEEVLPQEHLSEDSGGRNL